PICDLPVTQMQLKIARRIECWRVSKWWDFRAKQCLCHVVARDLRLGIWIRSRRSRVMVQHIKHPSIFSFLSVFAAIVVALAPASRADDAESEAVKLAQRSSYNVFTGNWDVRLDRPALSIAESFKRILPALDYHL